MSKRNEDEYNYLEWVIGIMMSVDTYCEQEIMRISHNEEDERPIELIDKIQKAIDSYKNQIPDDLREF